MGRLRFTLELLLRLVARPSVICGEDRGSSSMIFRAAADMANPPNISAQKENVTVLDGSGFVVVVVSHRSQGMRMMFVFTPES